MKLVMFAGGAGTRLWPLSRKNSPKQFVPLDGQKSTLQLGIERISSFGLDNIYVSTNEKYATLMQEQVPALLPQNILKEPAKRDLAAAIALTLVRLKEQGVSGPVALLWADHFMDHPESFVSALKQAEELVVQSPQQFVFFGEKPRYANQNLGWIHVGEKMEDLQSGFALHAFKEWAYRPEIERCKSMFQSGEWLWNPGYFVFDIDFCLELYQIHKPELIKQIREMVAHDDLLQHEYQALESISFDDAIVTHLAPEQAVVLPVDLGWSDPGTLYALKEAFVPSEDENYIKGHVSTLGTRDSFVYNEEDHKLVTTIGLDGICVVNTKDATLVVKKEDVPKIKELLKQLEEEGEESYL